MAIKATWYQTGRHVEDQDLLPAEPQCPFCLGSETREPILPIQANPDVFLLRCNRCGAQSASRLPTDEALRHYYSGYYEHSERAVTFDEPVVFARHVMASTGPFLRKKSVSILDFGGGGGDLSKSIAALLLRAGSETVRIHLCDYNSDLSEGDSESVSIERSQTLDAVKGKKFDLVLASAILEHIPQPRQILIDLLLAMDSGGVFYARTPTVSSILRILRLLGFPYDLTFPGHVHDLGQTFWESILSYVPSETGQFSILSSRPSIVETSFRQSPLRTVAAYSLKSPWYILRKLYPLVGGWEVVLRRLPTVPS
jgi:2-polyprenyl-3-methyl-5-hydroxy-6-metoxy-1,4-benzoquinol methylase